MACLEQSKALLLTARLALLDCFLILAFIPSSNAEEGSLGLSFDNNGVTIDKIAMRASGAMGAIYGRIRNDRPDQNITLVHVTTELEGKVELHTVEADDDGRLKMREVNHIVIPPKSTLNLLPNDKHIMLIGLAPSPSPGETITANFTFSDGTEIPAIVSVKPLTFNFKSYILE